MALTIVLLTAATTCAWPLEGRHAELPCNRCHYTPDHSVAGGADLGCARCHAPTHGDRYGAKCDTCHAPSRPFAEVVFPHRDFPLEGAHRTTPCATCHTRPARTVAGCVGCHLDPHRGGAGLDCDECHDGRGWLQVRFDHGATGFPLDGRHRAVTCRECHRNRFVGQPDGCVFCHGDEAPAGHHFPGLLDCGECHRTDTFVPARFQHLPASATSGVHARVARECNRCHTGRPLDAEDCQTCHQADLSQPHRQFLRGLGGPSVDCLDCHDRSLPWRAGLLFRHPIRLDGRHATLPCTSCHSAPLPMAIQAGVEQCRSCHLHQQPSRNHPTGVDCVDCHTTTAFFPATVQ